MAAAIASAVQAGEGTADPEPEIDIRKNQNYPLMRNSDMSEEVRTEVMELCVTAAEKFNNNDEAAARMIKDTLDKKFGQAWHVVIGENYSFEITHEVKSLLYMFFGGTHAIVVWKCS